LIFENSLRKVGLLISQARARDWMGGAIAPGDACFASPV
jgi:hypothetical protein